MKSVNRNSCKAYKLLRQRRDGTLGSLFINRKQILPENVWLKAESYPTRGFALRPGWHVTTQPSAPHLSTKGRIWRTVEVSNFKELKRPITQGGTWLIADQMRILPGTFMQN